MCANVLVRAPGSRPLQSYPKCPRARPATPSACPLSLARAAPARSIVTKPFLPRVAHDWSDWGGLPAAIQASKCGAINNQLVKAQDAEAVLALAARNGKQLNSVNAATALHRIAAHLKRDRVKRDLVLRDPRFTDLLDTTATLTKECNPRSVSDLMWAFATLQHWPPAMLNPLLTRVATHLQNRAFEAQHLALIAWSFAVLELKPVRGSCSSALARAHECPAALWPRAPSDACAQSRGPSTAAA